MLREAFRRDIKEQAGVARAHLVVAAGLVEDGCWVDAGRELAAASDAAAAINDLWARWRSMVQPCPRCGGSDVEVRSDLAPHSGPAVWCGTCLALVFPKGAEERFLASLKDSL